MRILLTTADLCFSNVKGVFYFNLLEEEILKYGDYFFGYLGSVSNIRFSK